LCDFTELIWEYGTDVEPNWVHIALMKGREKEKKVKRINKLFQKTKYGSFCLN